MQQRSLLWLPAVLFTLVGFFLMWVASEQLDEARQLLVEAREVPTGSFIFWILTMVAAGFSFGLADTLARQRLTKGRVGVLLGMSIIPLALLVYFFSVVLGWWALPISDFSEFLVSESTIVAASLVLGWFLSGVVARVPVDDEAADVR